MCLFSKVNGLNLCFLTPRELMAEMPPKMLVSRQVASIKCGQASRIVDRKCRQSCPLKFSTVFVLDNPSYALFLVLDIFGGDIGAISWGVKSSPSRIPHVSIAILCPLSLVTSCVMRHLVSSFYRLLPTRKSCDNFCSNIQLKKLHNIWE